MGSVLRCIARPATGRIASDNTGSRQLSVNATRLQVGNWSTPFRRQPAPEYIHNSPMVKKVMRPPCGSTSGGRPVAPCSALCHRGNPPVVQPPEKAEHFLYLDGFSLDGSARRKPLPLSSVKTRRTESTSTSIPLLTDRTHLSANAFRFGLLAGNFSGFTPPAFNTSRNDSQNLLSRSCRR